MDHQQFPTETWLQIVAKLQRDHEDEERDEDENSGRAALCQLSLTNHYFQSIAQPALFSTFKMDAGHFPVPSYDARTRERLNFISSPQVSGLIKMVNVRERVNVRFHPQASFTPTGENNLMKALTAHIENFHSLTRVKVGACYLSSAFFKQLFSARHLKSLDIGSCEIDWREFAPEILEAMPSFQLRELTISSLQSVDYLPVPDEWWTRFLSPNTLERLDIGGGDTGDALIRDIAKSELPFTSLKRLHVFSILPDSPHFLNFLRNLPALESFTITEIPFLFSTGEARNQPAFNIRSNILPRLNHITAHWYYIRSFLKHHHSLRTIGVLLSQLTQREELPQILDAIRKKRPEITSLTLSLQEQFPARMIKVALTKLPSLETFIARGFRYHDGIVDEMMKALAVEDFTPTLRTIKFGNRTRPPRGERFSQEMEEGLRKHPNMQIVNVAGLIWRR